MLNLPSAEMQLEIITPLLLLCVCVMNSLLHSSSFFIIIQYVQPSLCRMQLEIITPLLLCVCVMNSLLLLLHSSSLYSMCLRVSLGKPSEKRNSWKLLLCVCVMNSEDVKKVVFATTLSTSIVLLLMKYFKRSSALSESKDNRTITQIQKEQAKKRLPNFVWRYEISYLHINTNKHTHTRNDRYISYESGEGRTKSHIRQAFTRYKIVPRILRTASKTSTSTTLFSKKILSAPLLVAPTAFHSLYHPQGEEGTALGTSQASVGYCYNISLSNVDIGTVCNSTSSVKWAHIYLWKDRDYVLWQLKLAESLGFDAVIVTCDHPHDRVKHKTMPWFAPHENRKFPGRNQKTLKDIMRFPNLSTYREEVLKVHGDSNVAGINDDTLTFQDLKWVCENTSLPVVCKGVLSAKDALLAVEAGCKGVCVSNHGGRQLDRAVPAIDALRDVVKTLRENKLDDIIVLVDSGFRTSTDILIGLALGAHAVLLGRPVLWALASNGASGVKRLFNRLQEELLCDMKSLGVSSVEELRRCGYDEFLMRT